MLNTRTVIIRRAVCASVAMLGLGGAAIAAPGPGAMAAETGSHVSLAVAGDAPLGPPDPGRRAAAANSACDPADLPGGAEGPDNDGDECGFTVQGQIPLPTPPVQPSVRADSEFAEGSQQLAAWCDSGTYIKDKALGFAAADWFGQIFAPYAEYFLLHFLDGSGTSLDEADSTPLAFEASHSSVFQAADQEFQHYAKNLLDQGNLAADISKGLHTVDFSTSSIPDLFWGFGGTQGLLVNGSGYQENGRYVGTITYKIEDIYGFYAAEKFHGMGPRMHYLQGICGAPYHRGGAHWFQDSVSVTVPFDQPIG